MRIDFVSKKAVPKFMSKFGGTDFTDRGGGETPGGTPVGLAAPPESQVGDKRGNQNSISQPVDPGGVGGLAVCDVTELEK